MLAQATRFDAPSRLLRNTGGEVGLSDFQPLRQAVSVEPVPPDEAPRTEWNFGTLNSQQLNHAKVSDGRRG